MYPLDCEGIGEHCSESCHTEFGRIRAVGFIDPCYDLDINSQESWDEGVAGGFITIIPQTNGELVINQLQGDGYGKRPQTNTIKEYTLTYNDPTFIGNYNFYDGASGQYKYKIFFRTSDAIYFSDTAVLITPNFTIQNDLGQRIDWTVTLSWRSKFFPIINTALNSEYLFACTACTPQICFFIQSVTGNLVDNTDPCNPVIDAAVSADLGNVLTLGSDGLPFFDGSGIPCCDLQEVTDAGNTTTNDIQFGIGAGLLFDNGARVKEGTTDAGLGGLAGVALKCSIDYELKWDAGSLYVMEQNGFTIRKVVYKFSFTPTATDDATKGFIVGSLWILDDETTYECTDNTSGAAVWVLKSSAVPTLQQVTDAGNTTTNKIKVDALEFDLNPTNSPAAGQIAYEGNTGALAYLMNNSAVKSSIGQTLHAYVHNADSVTILKGQPVYIFGASGNKASVKLAANTSDSTSAKTLGLAAEDITSGQKGFVTCQGVLDGLNTGMYSDGDILYVGATAGTLTTTKPYAPNHLVYIGVVERANAGNGQIYVRVQNGYELDEIHDVDLISVAPVNNDILTYVTGTPNLWKPRSIAGILGYTPQEEIIKIIKSGSNQTTTSATAQNITELLVTNFEANKTYLIYGNIQASCNNTGGVKLGFTVPSGATGTLYTVNQTTGTTSLILALTNENSLFGSSVIRQTNATRDIFVYGRIEMGSTTGTVQFTFASNTTGETSTIFGGNNSMITFIKMN